MPDGPRFVMTAKDGTELAHFVVGSHTRQTGGTFLIVFPPTGEDGTLHEISMPHRPDFNVDRYVSRTEVAELIPTEIAAAETPASQQAPIFQDAGWTPEDEKVARELPSGVKIAIKKSGTGRAARATDSMVGHYAGWLEDGTLFDSTVDPRFGHPEPFRLVSQNAMIAGWKEGVVGMRVGEVRKLWIPASMGYGADGTGPVPPNADLIFEIQLLEIR
jgi:FKBP-type peptidyl-prolyl cis-trans isomerase